VKRASLAWRRAVPAVEHHQADHGSSNECGGRGGK
jgi:hypothetical protein